MKPFHIPMELYADIAYIFMTGLPGFGGGGFCMMDPETLRRQRITYVKYWLKRYNESMSRVLSANR